jgi:YjjG family noncanonical pyrimidine nucleotidase
MKKYTCVLFDLDHTLWDFESNSKETLETLFHQYGLREMGISSFPFFYETFSRINTGLWDLHDRGLLDARVIKEERFHKVMSEAGLDDFSLSQKFSTDFLAELPKKKLLLPRAAETLDHLYGKYTLGIITNGFDEIQSTKMNSAGILHYFENIVTSQRAGNKKPSPEIFQFALRELGHNASDSIMVGDNLQTDILGASSAGLDTVYFNPGKKAHAESVTHEIESLHELITIL